MPTCPARDSYVTITAPGVGVLEFTGQFRALPTLLEYPVCALTNETQEQGLYRPAFPTDTFCTLGTVLRLGIGFFSTGRGAGAWGPYGVGLNDA